MCEAQAASFRRHALPSHPEMLIACAAEIRGPFFSMRRAGRGESGANARIGNATALKLKKGPKPPARTRSMRCWPVLQCHIVYLYPRLQVVAPGESREVHGATLRREAAGVLSPTWGSAHDS